MLEMIELAPEQAPWELLLLADPSRDQIERYLPQSRLYGLIEGAEVVGVIVLQAHGQAIEVMNIAVAPRSQGRGLGKQMLSAAREIAKNLGGKMLTIGTGNSSLDQLALYQKVGFRITGVDSDFFVRNYPEPIIENGIVCRDMIRLSMDL